MARYRVAQRGDVRGGGAAAAADDLGALVDPRAGEIDVAWRRILVGKEPLGRVEPADVRVHPNRRGGAGGELREAGGDVWRWRTVDQDCVGAQRGEGRARGGAGNAPGGPSVLAGAERSPEAPAP